MGNFRQARIDEEMKKELSALIRDLKDPRIPNMVSIIAVTVTKDLKFAKVYTSVFGTDEQKKEALLGLKSSAGFLRKEIGRNMQLRSTPQLNFVLDSSIEYGAHINQIIREIGISGDDDESDN